MRLLFRRRPRPGPAPTSPEMSPGGLRPAARAMLAAMLACLALLAGAAARAHFTVDSVDRYFVVSEVDGRLLVRARVPLPFLLGAELDAAARSEAPVAAPVLGQSGPDIVLRPDLVAAHGDYFAGLLAGAHAWQVGEARADPAVLRWRIALMSQEAALPFGREARKILSLPSLRGPAPLGQALVDFELDLGPATGQRVAVRYALPPLQLPPGITISNNLVDAIADPPFRRRAAGQMTASEVIVLPPPEQAARGGWAGLRQGAAGLGGAMLAAGLLVGFLQPGVAGWTLAGVAAGLFAAEAVQIGAPPRPFLPLAAATLVAVWAALALWRRGGPVPALLLGLLIGAASGIEGLAALDGAGLRPVLRWSLFAGCLAVMAAAIPVGAALRALAARAPLRVRGAGAGALVLAMLALAGVQTAQAVTERTLGDLDPVLRLPVDAAEARGFDLLSAMLAELHRAVQTGPDAVAALIAGDPAEVLGSAAARLSRTGLPPTEPDLHEVALSAFQMRGSGRRLEVQASWQVLGLKARGGHEHVKGAAFAADFVLRRSWGRWRIEAFTLDR